MIVSVRIVSCRILLIFGVFFSVAWQYFHLILAWKRGKTLRWLYAAVKTQVKTGTNLFFKCHSWGSLKRPQVFSFLHNILLRKKMKLVSHTPTHTGLCMIWECSMCVCVVMCTVGHLFCVIFISVEDFIKAELVFNTTKFYRSFNIETWTTQKSFFCKQVWI